MPFRFQYPSRRKSTGKRAGVMARKRLWERFKEKIP
jgi:hypothetical protein